MPSQSLMRPTRHIRKSNLRPVDWGRMMRLCMLIMGMVLLLLLVVVIMMMVLNTRCLDEALAIAAGAMGGRCIAAQRHECGCSVEVFTRLLLLLLLDLVVGMLHIRSCPLGPLLGDVAVSCVGRLLMGRVGHVSV